MNNRRWLQLFLLTFCFALPQICFGQAENIFGAPGSDSGFGTPSSTTQTSTGSSTKLPDEDRHVVVQSLRRNPPKTAEEISRAILYMTRIERWDEVGRYVDQLAKISIDETLALKMVRSGGLETWFKLSLQTNKLSETQRSTANKIIELSSGAIRNPTTLQSAIANLNSNELATRKRGVMAIQAAGESGLSALLESIVASDKPPVPIMSEAIITMGSEGESALKAAIGISNEKFREKLLWVATRIPGGTYMAELVSSIHSLSPESDTLHQIQKSLSPTGQALPELISSQRFVCDQMKSELNEFRIFRRDSTPSIHSVWRWSLDEKHLLTELDSTAGVHLERAFQLARLNVNLSTSASFQDTQSKAQRLPSDLALATAIIFERHYRVSPSIDLEPIQLLHAFQPSNQIDNLDFLGQVWDVAKKEELLAAQLRIVQSIGVALKNNPANSAGVMSRLVEATKDSAPAIRYTAAVVLSQQPSATGNFEGRYALEQTTREILNLESKPQALLIGGSIELRDILSNQLSLLGVRTLSAKSARETLRLIQEPQPIEFIFIVDRVLEMHLSELVQRLRAHPRTRALPLAVLTDQLGTAQRTLLTNEGVSNIHYFSATTNLDLTSTLLNEMQRTSPLPKMDLIDRITWRSRFEPVTKNSSRN